MRMNAEKLLQLATKKNTELLGEYEGAQKPLGEKKSFAQRLFTSAIAPVRSAEQR